MSKKSKIIVGAMALGVVLALVLSKGLATKDIDMLNSTAEVEITAENLLSVLGEGNQKAIDSLKSERVFEVAGWVKETNLMNGRITVLLKGNEDLPPYIICDMMPHQKKAVSQLKPNDSVKIKGIFKGFLKDAVFLDCIITFSQTND
ncbi:MAG: hypothetical protein R2819_14670 [Allomuricauda sp.]